jgi:hypothetical protein
MDGWFQLKTRAIWLVGIGLALVGLLLVVQLVALLVWQYLVALETRNWPSLSVRLLFADHSQLARTSVAPFLQFIPELQWNWIRIPQESPSLHSALTWLLDKVHIGLIPAVLGVPIALRGGVLAIQQKSTLADAKRRKEDRLRRIGHYRKEQQGLTASPRDQDSMAPAYPEGAIRRRSRVRGNKKAAGETIS